MHVIVIGGHGQIGLRLERLLVSTGHIATGLVRNPDHRDDVSATGARVVVCDLEQATVDEVVPHLQGADAVVFAAGAGPGSGAPRKDTMDRGGAVLTADAAERAGVRRYLQISSMGAGAEPPPGTDETVAAYLRAKTAAEQDLRARDLDWTVLRPGRLTNEPGHGHVALAPPPLTRGSISRDDVANVLAALVTGGHGIGLTLDLVEGDVAIDEAVHSLPTP